MARRAKGQIEKALEAELKTLSPRLRKLALAATAARLARELDGSFATPAEVATCARAFRATLDRLHELDTDKPQADSVDELARRREVRRSRARPPAS